MSIEAKLILIAIGTGYRMVVPWDYPIAPAQLEDGLPSRDMAARGLDSPPREAIGPLNVSAVEELLSEPGLLKKVEQKTTKHRRGLEDMTAVDGRFAEVYSMRQ